MEGELPNKKGRVIIRNLVFSLGKKQIQQLFAPFGEIVEINLPINNTNNLNKGFAFVQFKTRQEATKAISKLNGTTFKGRVIAVDLSVPKTVYKMYEDDSKKNEEVNDDEESDEKDEVENESVSIRKKDKKNEEEIKDDLKEIKTTKEKRKEKKKKDKKKEENNDEESEEEEINEDEENKSKKNISKKKPNNFNEKTTLFVRNISFDTTEEEFKDYFSSYGEVNYAKLCMNPETKMNKVNES